ncbi:hypothetical protein [Brevibacillus sp. BC25]|uniref:hypothetical protein n=1 Tax=Brevibacillus sp. BC25 TaxID=1144308 RepID=UPI00027128F6|nr:hypothetical protein [Brevibacillus sp. BC25]EJL29933.1 hypothetical protein PMI05_01548 [Brevibacillus sp. BC25]
MKKVTFDCVTGETVEVDMTQEEIAELDQITNRPPTLTQEELLLLALTDTQLRLAEQQALTDQLALAISQIQIGGAQA